MFSKATNLETLYLSRCESLVELPSSISNLHKLKELRMNYCVKLRVIPTNINLASLESVGMRDCLRLRTFPDISSNIIHLHVPNTMIEDVPSSVIGLEWLEIGSRSLKRLKHVPLSLASLDLSDSDIKKIPDCVIGHPVLKYLGVQNCRKLVSLQGIPPSLLELYAGGCASLKSVSFLESVFSEQKTYITLNDCKCVKSEDDAIRVSFILDNPSRRFIFQNCLKLDEETRRAIIQRWAYEYVFLPGKEIPAEFSHRATGNSVTISSGTFSESSRFKACLLLSPTEEYPWPEIVCRLRSKGVLIKETKYSLGSHKELVSLSQLPRFLAEHLFVFSGPLFEEHRCLEAEATTSEIQFEFSWEKNDKMIIECGVQILALEGEIQVSSCFDDPNREVKFFNCLSLDEEARRAIIQRWAYKYVCLPGKQIPAEFTHRATGSSITISSGNFSASSSFKACLLLSPTLEYFRFSIFCRLRSKGVLINELQFCGPYSHRQPPLLTEHLFVFPGALFKEHRCVEVEASRSEIHFDFEIVFTRHRKDDEIIINECGVQILAEEGETSKWKNHNDRAIQVSKDESIVKSSKHTGCWSWLKKLGMSKKEKKINKTE